MASEWIEHVKKYAKENGIKYGEALSKAGATFKKTPMASPMESPMKMSKSKKRKGSKKTRGSKKSRGTRRR